MTKMTECARETRSRNLFNGRVNKRIVAVFIPKYLLRALGSILRGEYDYAYSWGRPKWNIISYFRGYSIYRLEDIPFIG